jgi:internalin A
MSLLFGLPIELQIEIVCFFLRENATLSCRKVCKLMRDLYDQTGRYLWNKLKRSPPPGPIEFQILMTNIETDPTFKHKNIFYFFKELSKQIKIIYDHKRKLICTSTQFLLHPVHFAEAQELYRDKLEDSLSLLWQKIVPHFGTPPDIRLSADAIRVFIADSENFGSLRKVKILNQTTGILTVLPHEILALTQLEHLDISGNFLAVLPDLSQLILLQKLIIDQNLLKLLSYLNLPHLRILSASKNQLTKIPDFDGLGQLRELDLHNNKLTKLPNLSPLVHLEKLDLHNNRLTKLPELQDLTQLRILRVHSNLINKIPEWKTLTGLQIIELHNNMISKIPEMGAMNQLHILSLSHNMLSTIPDINGLTQLKILLLNNNSLRELPDISSVPLETLDVGYNQLIQLPSMNVQHLNMLEIRNNYWIHIAANVVHKFPRTFQITEFLTQLSYIAETPLARFYQTLIQAPFQDEGNLKKEFENLPIEDIRDISQVVAKSLGCSNQSIFLDLKIFARAVQKTIFTRYSRLSAEMKSRIIAKLSGRTSALRNFYQGNFGDDFVFRNIPKLLDIMFLLSGKK